MVAKRMLTEREKLSITAQLMGLKDVIEKNEICSDNSEEIKAHLTLIETLITR